MNKDTDKKVLTIDDCATILKLNTEALIKQMEHKSREWKNDLSKKNVSKALTILHHEAPYLEEKPYKSGTPKYCLTSEIHKFLADHTNYRERNLVLNLPKRQKRKLLISFT